MVTLYKKNGNKVQQWSIEIQGDQYRSIEGFVGGVLTTSQWTVATGKNIGKKNETSPQDQANNEALAKIKLKLDKGYVHNVSGESEARFEPMLAHKYNEQKAKINYPCYVQPKLDGMRCPIDDRGAWSRQGKPVTAVPHIVSTLKKVMDEAIIVMDGELYNHDLRGDFNRLISLVKKNRDGTEEIQYHTYDCFFPGEPEMLFEERYERLCDLIDGIPYVLPVYTAKVNNPVELETFYTKFLEEGYEGMMIRNNTPYIQKRTINLLKRKEWLDDEYEIVDIIEGIGNRSGMMGKFVLKTASGEEFEADASGLGGHEAYKEFLTNMDDYIGRLATVKYQNLTPDRHVPRFGKVIAIRDYE